MTHKERLENDPALAGKERCWRCNQLIGDDAYEVTAEGLVEHWWGDRDKACINLALPSIHLNGTSRAVLHLEYEGALQAVRDAETALAHTAPNMRDYYVRTAGADEFKQAEAEHRMRMYALERVREELEKLVGYVATAEGPGRL